MNDPLLFKELAVVQAVDGSEQLWNVNPLGVGLAFSISSDSKPWVHKHKLAACQMGSKPTFKSKGLSILELILEEYWY